MRDKLKRGDKIVLYPVGKEEGTEFSIRSIMGEGHSCVVYNASYEDEEENKFFVRIKEYYPEEYVDFRDSDHYLCVEEYAEEFAEYMKYFERGYQVQAQLRLQENLVNSISNIQGIYENYGTKYIVTTYQSGENYTGHLDKNMYELFQVIKATTRVIAEYHKLGYLHLDIKPDNIFRLKETAELVILFDFDSLVRKEELSAGSLENLSYTKKYAAPELAELRLEEISEQTDFYSIGLIAYERLTGSTEYDGSVCYNPESALLKNVNPKVIGLLNRFFEKTLSPKGQDRYGDVQELLQEIEGILKVCQPSTPYIISNGVAKNLQFVGREEILAQMHDTLKNRNVLCLHGIGGIGKTEIANEYLCRYQKDYDVTRRIVYGSSIKEAIISDSSLPIHNFMRLTKEGEEEYYQRKLSKLQELCNKRVLFIIDNFDTQSDDCLMDLLSLNCDFIFTSRHHLSDGHFWNMEVPPLEKGALLELFRMFYPYGEEEEETVIHLLELVEQHTMSVELIAKQIAASNIRPLQMYERLTKQSEKDLQESVTLQKDGRSTSRNMFAHIHNLFYQNNLEKQAKKILFSMTFFGNKMIDLSTIQSLLGLENLEDVNQLERCGWVKFGYEERQNTRQVYLHPVIKEFIVLECREDISYGKEFFTSISEQLHMLLEKKGKKKQDSEEQSIPIGRTLIKNIIVYLCRNEKLLAEEYYEEWIAGVLGDMVDYLLYAGEYSFLENISDEILTRKEQVHAEYIFLAGALKGIIYHELKVYEKEIEYKLQLTELIKKKLKEQKGLVADLYYEIGLCYSRMGDVAQAKKYYKLGNRAYARHPFLTMICNTDISFMRLLIRAELLFYSGKEDMAKRICRMIAMDTPNSSRFKMLSQGMYKNSQTTYVADRYDSLIMASELMIMMGEKTEDPFYIEQGKISRYMLACRAYGTDSLETGRYLKDLILHHYQKEEDDFARRLMRDYIKVMRRFYAGTDHVNLDFWYEVFQLLQEKGKAKELIHVYEYNIIGEHCTKEQTVQVFRILSWVVESYIELEKYTEAQMAYLRLQQLLKKVAANEQEECSAICNALGKRMEELA